MNLWLIPYLMDHLPTEVLQDPPWTADVHGRLAGAAAWWPIYVAWRNPYDLAGFMDWPDAMDAAGGAGVLIPVQCIVQQGLDDGEFHLPTLVTVFDTPMVLACQAAAPEEEAVGRARRRYAAG